MVRPLRPDADRLQLLMIRYQNGDGEAAGEIVDTLSPQMFQFFLAQVRSRSDAQDLLQDLWLRIHNARATYRPGEPLLPWIYTIAHRVRIDAYRRTRRVVQHELKNENAMAGATVSSKQPASGKEVPELLNGLPESQREVLLLMKVSGLTLEEVARATGSTVGAVKQKAHRAYETLRKLLPH
ncbi:MAG: polymerase, sigma-24 subunit, subfamily [Bryobacterales bacterium]|nr:polymerase, sigma-24 subunit, subfamily [Bryobacterales bacterium]